MPIIVESNQASAEMFSAAMGTPTHLVASLEQLKQSLSDAHDEYAVILGPGVDLEAATALADTLRVTRPATSVILVRRRVDTGVLAEALRSGMREVVEERDLTGLSGAVRRASEVWEALHGPIASTSDSPAGRVITVFSPKGGVGKTTIAVNLGLALSNGGAKKVCVVDLDLAFGDVAITLQLFPTRTFADVVSTGASLDRSLLDTILTPFGNELSILVAPVQPDAKESISAALVGRTLGLLRSEFDYVIVDTAPAFDEHVLQAFDETDEIVLVTTLDVPTLKNVKIATETLDLLNFPAGRRHLVLNRADDKVGLSPGKVEETLGMKICQSIPTSPQVASSTNCGEPIFASSPKHPASLAVSALAQRFVATPAGSASLAPPKAHSPLKRGLLRKSR